MQGLAGESGSPHKCQFPPTCSPRLARARACGDLHREKAGIEPYVPRPQRGPAVKACLFRKDEFRYDAASDRYVCPTGQRLHPYSSSLLRGLTKINDTNKLACDACAIRSRCTDGRFRTVSRLQNEAVLVGQKKALRPVPAFYVSCHGNNRPPRIATRVERRAHILRLPFD